MDSNQLTQMSRQAITDAQALARRRSNNEVETWHLLASLLSQENGIVPGIIDKLNVTTSAVQLSLERQCGYVEGLRDAGGARSADQGRGRSQITEG